MIASKCRCVTSTTVTDTMAFYPVGQWVDCQGYAHSEKRGAAAQVLVRSSGTGFYSRLALNATPDVGGRAGGAKQTNIRIAALNRFG